jgi:hypothetical protein
MCEADVIAIMAKLKRNVAPFDITEVAHPAHECLAVWIVVRGSGPDVPDARGLVRLLRAPRQRTPSLGPSSLYSPAPKPGAALLASQRIRKRDGCTRD